MRLMGGAMERSTGGTMPGSLQRYEVRHLPDEQMDMIDHALGRPRYPHLETYRNRYVVMEDDPVCVVLSNSEYWQETPRVTGGHMVSFVVTETGKRALQEYLTAYYAKMGR